MNSLQQQAMERVGETGERIFGLGEPSGSAPDIFESMGMTTVSAQSLSILTPQEPSSICGGGVGYSEEAQIEALRKAFWDAHRAAERAAHALFAALPVGRERERAAEIYENIRLAPRVA